MEKKDNKSSGAEKVQVFELTMDNPENQDELNRRLCKPGESAPCGSAKIGGAGISSATGPHGELAENK